MQKQIITDRIAEIRGRIAEACDRYDRDADDITLVAVSKTRSESEIRTAVAAGLNNIGESKIQEAEPKIQELGHICRYHMLGHLQTNKVKKAVALFDVIQSLDSLRLAEEINARAGEVSRTIECLVEINSSGESAKFGVSPENGISLIEKILSLPHIRLTGLMTLAPQSDDEELVRAAFRRTAELFARAKPLAGQSFVILSMGMTDDFPLAIAEGSTMVRVGTGIFGPRQQ